MKETDNTLLGNLSPCIYMNSNYTECCERNTEDTDPNDQYSNTVQVDLIIDTDESNFYDDTIYDEEWEFYTEELDSIQQDFWQLKEFTSYLVHTYSLSDI